MEPYTILRKPDYKKWQYQHGLLTFLGKLNVITFGFTGLGWGERLISRRRANGNGPKESC
jgi:hypothetical protein